MNKDVIKKIIEIINMDLIGLYLSNKSVGKTLSVKYNKENNSYSYSLTTNLQDNKVIENKQNLTLKEIIEIILNPEFSDDLINTYNKRIEKEEKYYAAKQNMYQELSAMNLNKDEFNTLVEIIEQVSQLPEIVGFGNSVVISSTNDSYEEVRLTDETRWNNVGPILHLQLVQTVDHGMNFRSYPKMTFEELVKYICKTKLNKVSNKVK